MKNSMQKIQKKSKQLTNDWRTEDRSNALTEEAEAEATDQPTQTEKLNDNDGAERVIGGHCETEDNYK